jgi:hypothetical protein
MHQFTPPRKNYGYVLSRRLHGIQGFSGIFEKDKNLLLLPGKETEYICVS